MATPAASANVWVTRPSHQADGICSLLTGAGMNAVRFPVIEIQPITESDTLATIFGDMTRYQFLVFVSQNAVSLAIGHYLDTASISPDTVIVAIGSSTASMLQQQGLTNVLLANGGTDSEALLAMPELQADSVTGTNILLVRGQGGRALLVDTLTQRGATVEIAEVYMRNTPQYDTNETMHLWQHVAPDAIIVTSNESIENLVQLTPDAKQQTLLQTPLVVMSARNAEYAGEQGFTGTITVTSEMNDSGLCKATLDLLEIAHT